MTELIRIDRERLWASLVELREIGGYDNEATGLRGVRRLALTDADAEARRRCVHSMVDGGLDVRVDRIGNVYATRPGRDRSLPCVLMGFAHRHRRHRRRLRRHPRGVGRNRGAAHVE